MLTTNNKSNEEILSKVELLVQMVDHSITKMNQFDSNVLSLQDVCKESALLIQNNFPTSFIIKPKMVEKPVNWVERAGRYLSDAFKTNGSNALLWETAYWSSFVLFHYL